MDILKELGNRLKFQFTLRQSFDGQIGSIRTRDGVFGEIIEKVFFNLTEASYLLINFIVFFLYSMLNLQSVILVVIGLIHLKKPNKMILYLQGQSIYQQ